MRFFNSSQRRALYGSADGRCMECGLDLPENWHADHILPYVIGGSTDVINGQALCPNCNQQKGTTVTTMNIHQWQQRFLDHFLQLLQRDFLLVATPGSGKTFASLKASRELLNAGTVDRIVIVVPSRHLKRQWAREAHKNISLSLEPDWTGSLLRNTSYRGIVITYQSLDNSNLNLRKFCADYRTLVIFDEIHHLGLGTWGESALDAFEHAAFRLGLSGTPFRSDNAPIPFIRYEPMVIDGISFERSHADFEYGYEEALRDRVCRPLIFPHFDGSIEWIGRFGQKQAMMTDDLSCSLDSERMRTYLDPKGQAMQDLCKAGDLRLTHCRKNGHPDAGGLLICSNRWAAEKFCALMTRISGERAMVVASEYENGDTIDAFRESTCRWLVAIRMVSEGVDIDRLRVLIYATDIKTELFFRQAVGRVVRGKVLPQKQGIVLIPEHPLLRQYAATIRAEVRHVFPTDDPEMDEPNEIHLPSPSERTESIFQPLSSEAIETGSIGIETRYTSSELDLARRYMQEIGLESAQPEQIVDLLRKFKSDPLAEAPEKHTDSVPDFEEEERLRRECNALAYRIDRLLGHEPGETNTEWKRMGGKGHAEASIDDLKQKFAWLTSELVRIGCNQPRSQPARA